ncbi:MAG: cell division protein FtsQ/DivIB [Mariprofundaceae bacterium]
MLKRNRHIRPLYNWRRLGKLAFRFCTITLLASGVGFVSYMANEAFDIRHLHILDADQSLKIAIQEELGRLDFIHSRPARIRRILRESLPDIADVRVERRLPHTLVISTQVRQPVALWADHENIYLVDVEGFPYRQMRQSEDLDLPLVRLSADQLPEAIQLLTTLMAVDQKQSGRLSECLYDDSTWKLYFDSGQRWLLPGGSRTEDVIRRLYALMNKAPWRNGIWQVDARYPDRWFIRQARHGGII